MKTQSYKSVQLRCGHYILVPTYQTSKLEDYDSTPCSKCDTAAAAKAIKGKK